MNKSYNLVSCLGLSLLAVGCGESKQAQQTKPNFIIILADDLGYNDLGCYGSALIKTPQLDKMAQEGIRMTDFYSQPISGPARTALLTGCYPVRVAEVGDKKLPHPKVHPDEVIIPEVLKTADYVSGCIGKWDINGHSVVFDKDEFFPTEMGFDSWYGAPQTGEPGIRGFYRDKQRLDPEKEGVTLDNLTQTYTKEAISFIEQNQDNPFFLYLAHNMPHTKLGVSNQFAGVSKGGLYGDVVEELDWCVGQILDKLEELDLDDNTYVIFYSDNGPWTARELHAGSAYPLRGSKVTTWEGGVRVPCIIWGKEIKPDVCERVTSSMDLFPTFAALSGAELPADLVLDGRDISPLFNNEPIEDGCYLYYHYTHLQAVRKGDWKLVLPRPEAPLWLPGSISVASDYIREDTEAVRDYELYNLRDDLSERRDVADKHPEIVADLMLLVESSREDLGDYYAIGDGARFCTEGDSPRKNDAKMWRDKLESGWSQEIKVHKFYNNGARYTF